VVTRTPAQIIGNDHVSQLIFEGYVIVPAKVTEAMAERMAQIEDGPARTYQEYWTAMLDVASGEKVPLDK